MNPLLAEFLGALLRHALTIGAGWFISQGILTPEQGERMILGAITAILAIAWALWQKYWSRLKLVTALALPKGSTEAYTEQVIATGQSPSTTVAKTEVPVLK